MAWNRPTSNNVDATSSSRPSGRDRKPGLKHGILAGAIIVVLGALCCFIFSGNETRQDAASTKGRGRIKEVTPAAAPKTAEKPKSKWPKYLNVPDDWDKPYPPQAYWPDGRLKEHSMYVKVVTNKVRRANLPMQEAYFTNLAERDIAGVLLIQPGANLVGGGPKFDKYFLKHFLGSLNTPIVINDDDPPSAKELKEAVIAVKDDLKARHARGEDIVEYMNNSVRELRELGLYRKELEDQVDRIRKEKGTDFGEEDIKTLYAAADQMLSERGLPPLRGSTVFRQKLRMREALRNHTKSLRSEKENSK